VDEPGRRPGRAETRLELARWLPKVDRPPAAGSRSRLVELRDGKPFWENEPIDPASQPE